MATNLDIRFEDALAKDRACRRSCATRRAALENSSAVQKRLASLRPASHVRRAPARQAPEAGRAGDRRLDPGREDAVAAELGRGARVRRHPGLVQHAWRPAAVARRAAGARRDRRLLDVHVHQLHPHAPVPEGAVRHLPPLRARHRRHRGARVHVRAGGGQRRGRRSTSDGITYPVVQDNNLSTWNAYKNEYWPADYFIDAHGDVRHTQFGEGDYKQDEAVVRQLLYDAGARQLPPPMTAHRDHPLVEPRDGGDVPEPATRAGVRAGAESRASTPTRWCPRSSLQLNEFSLGGSWNVGSESVTPAGARGVDRGRHPGRSTSIS